MLENLSKEIKPRTYVVTILPKPTKLLFQNDVSFLDGKKGGMEDRQKTFGFWFTHRK
jgi:hypothetical protein